MKVATVFSGIGAIEHAVQMIGIPYEVVFACDNGDINPFDLKVKKSYLSILSAYNKLDKELKDLNGTQFVDNNVLDLEEQRDIIKKDFKELEVKLLVLSNHLKNQNEKLLKEIEESKLSPSLEKKYLKYKEIDLLTVDFLEDYQKYIKKKLKVVGEIKKTDEYKEINDLMNRVISEMNMLYERIATESIRKKLDEVDTLQEEKTIVDQLYRDSGRTNYVYKSYMANYDLEEEHFHQDARFLNGSYYKGKVDLFVGGSPCQSFSLVGKRRGLEDTRGTLFYEYARLVKEIKPKVFIYENVKGLLSHDGGETWKTMQYVFEELGYEWHAKLLNAKDYGIPQNRERIFVVGFRKDLDLKKSFEFPKEIPLEITMQDLLLENVSGKYYLNQKGVDFVTSDKNIKKRYTQISGDIQLCQKANQQFNWHGDFIFEEEEREKEEILGDLERYFLSPKVKKYVLSSGTKTFYSKPEIDLEVARPLLTTMHKMHRAGVDNYVTTSGRIRKLTPRETLRLMGFCDSFKIVVSDTQMYRQAGNSIVVNVLIHLLNSIHESYDEIFK